MATTVLRLVRGPALWVEHQPSGTKVMTTIAAPGASGQRMTALTQGLLDGPRRVVVLSPHLDDAVLSCGALMAGARRGGVSMSTVTVFNGLPEGEPSPAAREFHERCGHGDDAMTYREAEDDDALDRLGVTSHRLGLPEALYRRDHAGGYLFPDGQSIFRADPAAEHELILTLVELLAGLDVVAQADLVLAPLSVGNHIDHQIVAEVARRLDHPVAWFEDVPYALYEHCTGWQARLLPTHPLPYHATTAEWQAKLDAVDCYASQTPILWPDPPARQKFLTDYAIAVGNGKPTERYWGGRGW